VTVYLFYMAVRIFPAKQCRMSRGQVETLDARFLWALQDDRPERKHAPYELA
jgi:hypothetical protein